MPLASLEICLQPYLVSPASARLFQLPICRKTRSQPLGLQSEQLLPARKHSPYFPITSDEAHCDCHPAGGRQRSRAHQGVTGGGKSMKIRGSSHSYPTFYWGISVIRYIPYQTAYDIRSPGMRRLLARAKLGDAKRTKQ